MTKFKVSELERMARLPKNKPQSRGRKSALPTRGYFGLTSAEWAKREQSSDWRVFLPPAAQIRHIPSGSRPSQERLAKAIWYEVEYYKSMRDKEIRPKRFRVALKKQLKAVNRFLKVLPEPKTQLAIEISKNCSSEFIKLQLGGLRRLSADELSRARQLFRGPRFAMERIRQELQILQNTLKGLIAAESGAGKDADRPAHHFLNKLTLKFERQTGHTVRRNNDAYRDGNDAVAGPFGTFVRSVNGRIPKAYRLKNIDNLIRLRAAARRSLNTKSA